MSIRKDSGNRTNDSIQRIAGVIPHLLFMGMGAIVVVAAGGSTFDLQSRHPDGSGQHPPAGAIRPLPIDKQREFDQSLEELNQTLRNGQQEIDALLYSPRTP